MTHPEVLRLAQALNNRQECEDEAADELRRLHTDAEESEALRERLSELLRNTAIALRGPEPELTRWSWHDLPELATALKAQRDALLEALRAAVADWDEEVSRGRWLDAARAAIKKAEAA